MGGGKGGKKAKAPDYTALAIQQGEQDRATANAITQANRPTQNDGLGNSISWTQNGNNWTQNVNYSPEVRQGLMNQIANQQQAQGLYSDALSRMGERGEFSSADMPTYDLSSGREVADATYNSVMDRALPQQQRDVEAFTNRLRQQGLQPGTEAFDRAMRNLTTSQADANNLAAQNATLAGYDEARQRYLAQLKGQGQQFQQDYSSYMLPSQEASVANALAGSAYTPQFAGFSSATGYQPADLLGAAQAQYSAKMGSQNANNAMKGGLLQSGMGMVGSFMGGK